MNIRLQVILIISSIIFFLFVLLVTNKKKMNFNYTMLWMIFSLAILILALFPNITIEITKSRKVGIKNAIKYTAKRFKKNFFFILRYFLSCNP